MVTDLNGFDIGKKSLPLKYRPKQFVWCKLAGGLGNYVKEKVALERDAHLHHSCAEFH